MSDVAITQITVGFGQNYRVTPKDPYVMARVEIQMTASLVPGITKPINDVKNELFQACRDAVLETIYEQEQAAAKRAADDGVFE